MGLKICAITAGIKKYKSIIKKKNKKHDEIVLLEKAKSNAIEILISKSLIDAFISHDEFVSVDNVLREYNEMKKEEKSWNFWGICYIKTLETYCVSCKKYNAFMKLCCLWQEKSTFVKNQELHNFND